MIRDFFFEEVCSSRKFPSRDLARATVSRELAPIGERKRVWQRANTGNLDARIDRMFAVSVEFDLNLLAIPEIDT